jgi:TatD DNase family protein
MKFIDIHCHLDMAQFDADREDVVERMRDSDMVAITVGVDFQSSVRAVELADKYDGVYACVGVHPEEVVKGELDNPQWKDLLAHPKTVAVGECGLDYFRSIDSEATRKAQVPVFERQIEWAIEYEKPLMLHVRPSKGMQDAYEDVLDILERYKKDCHSLLGNSHFFAGGLEIAQRFFSIGFTVSFTGVITFARQYDEIIQLAPLDMLHAETDSPFVAPEPHRGKRNEPMYVSEVVKKIADIRGESEEAVMAVLRENAKRVFDI